jgi:hypothetical protein
MFVTMSGLAVGAVVLVLFVTRKHWLPAAERDVKTLEQRVKTAEAKLKALGHGEQDDVDKLIAAAKQVAQSAQARVAASTAQLAADQAYNAKAAFAAQEIAAVLAGTPST